jgi:hypothetical protein
MIDTGMRKHTMLHLEGMVIQQFGIFMSTKHIILTTFMWLIKQLINSKMLWLVDV